MSSEAQIQHAILLALGCREDLRVWRQNTGCARSPKTGRLVRFGVPGWADIGGVLFPTGRLIQLEVKGPKGRQSPEQKAWEQMVTRFGGFYRVVRSVEEAVRAVEAAKAGLVIGRAS